MGCGRGLSCQPPQGRCNACGWQGELDNVDKPLGSAVPSGRSCKFSHEDLLKARLSKPADCKVSFCLSLTVALSGKSITRLAAFILKNPSHSQWSLPLRHLNAKSLVQLDLLCWC